MCFGLLQEIIQGCLTIFTEEYTVYKSFALREAKCTYQWLGVTEFRGRHVWTPIRSGTYKMKGIKFRNLARRGKI